MLAFGSYNDTYAHENCLNDIFGCLSRGSEYSSYYLLESDLFEVFSLILILNVTVIVTFAAAAGYFVYMTVARNIKQTTKSRIEKHETNILRTSTAFILVELGYQYYTEFGPILGKFLSGEHDEKDQDEKSDCIVKIKFAIEALTRAKKVIKDSRLEPDSLFTESLKLAQIYIQVENSLLYNEVSLIVLSGDENISRSRAEAFENRIKILRKLCLDRRLVGEEFEWYNIFETIAYCKMYIGMMSDNKNMAEEGQRIIEDLCEKCTPMSYLQDPTNQWCQNLREEYFDHHYRLRDYFKTAHI